MKKTAFVLGYAGSILALVFSMLMIITVPLNLADNLLNDITEELKPEHILALNDTALKMSEEGWTDYSDRGLREIAKEAAQDSDALADEDVYVEAVKFAHKAGLNAMISLIVVAASIVLAIVSLIGALIVKKAPTAGGVLLLLTGFFLLLAAIYTGTLIPTFIASLFLALGGIAVFIPARMNRSAPALAAGTRAYAPPQYAPPSGYAPPAPPRNAYAPQSVYAPPTPPQSGYAPQYAPAAPQGGYAPQYVPQAPAAPVPAYAPAQAAPVGNYASDAPAQAAPAVGSGLPFPEEAEKPDGDEA